MNVISNGIFMLRNKNTKAVRCLVPGVTHFGDCAWKLNLARAAFIWNKQTIHIQTFFRLLCKSIMHQNHARNSNIVRKERHEFTFFSSFFGGSAMISFAGDSRSIEKQFKKV